MKEEFGRVNLVRFDSLNRMLVPITMIPLGGKAGGMFDSTYFDNSFDLV
jgi:hypothetical protein